MLQVHILSDHLIEYFTMTGETMATTNEEHFERFFQRKKQVIFFSFLILSYLILSYLILSYLIKTQQRFGLKRTRTATGQNKAQKLCKEITMINSLNRGYY